MARDPFADLPKDMRRKLKRALKLRAYTDIFGQMESDKWMGGQTSERGDEQLMHMSRRSN